MKKTTTRATSIHEVRRDVVGGKRGDGHERQDQGRKVRRADPDRIRLGEPDASLTGVGGLAAFGAFVKSRGLDLELKEHFGHLKQGSMVVYPMHGQIRLLFDANVAGETRVFGLESLAADPLFVHLAGGVVPSIDTVYRDLCRFDDDAIGDLELLVAQHGLAGARSQRGPVHLDIDTTVEPLFGAQEGALPGPNPRCRSPRALGSPMDAPPATRIVAAVIARMTRRPASAARGGKGAVSALRARPPSRFNLPAISCAMSQPEHAADEDLFGAGEIQV